MLPHIHSTTDALPIRPVASLGGFATPPQMGNTHGNPPRTITTQAQAQAQQAQTQQPPLMLTNSHTSPCSWPMVNESSFRLFKQGVAPANIYDPRLPPPSTFSANINLSPTSTAGSSGAPPSVGHTATTTTSACKNSTEMEDEPRDFAELPKTSPHFNTHLLLPLHGVARQHASTAGPGQEEQDPFRSSKLSFAPIFAPVEIVPYGSDRVLFVEGLICEYCLSFSMVSHYLGVYLFVYSFIHSSLIAYFGFFCGKDLSSVVTRHFATYTRVQASEADT